MTKPLDDLKYTDGEHIDLFHIKRLQDKKMSIDEAAEFNHHLNECLQCAAIMKNWLRENRR